MSTQHNFSEEQDDRIIEIYKGEGETGESAAKKASIEFGETINPCYVHGLAKKRGIAGKKGGRPGVSHEGHFHGGEEYLRIKNKSLTEEMKEYIIKCINSHPNVDFSDYRHVNASFKEKYGKMLDIHAFQITVTECLGISEKDFWRV